MQVETHPISERSWLMYLIQTIIRPFRPYLVTPSKSGSPRLSIPNSVKRKCVVTERCIERVWCYDLDDKYASGSHSEQGKKGRILYFCGGGFLAPPSSHHWSFAIELSRQLPHLNLTIISYPLAPRSNGHLAIPILHKVNQEISNESKRLGEDMILCGDYSGGNIALSLTLYILSTSTDSENSKFPRILKPKSLMLICPVVDCSTSNPEKNDFNELDPVLNKEYISKITKQWYGDISPLDPIVSPLQGDLTILKDNDVIVNGIIGTYDVLAPDMLKLIDRLEEIGVNGIWRVQEGQMHCFPLAWGWGIRDCVKGKNWIVDVLKKSTM